MFFFFILGSKEFTSPLKGYEGITAQCHNCGNWSAHCIKRWPWFTICWIPVLPLAFHPYKEVACPVCHFIQDIKNRQDIQSQGVGGAPAAHAMGPPPPGGPGYAPQVPQYK